MTKLRLIAVLTATLALAGCLVSENAILDEKNARAAPLAPGLYEGCNVEDGVESDCLDFDISRDGSGRYLFAPRDEDEEPLFARFAQLSGGGYVGGFASAEAESFMYLFAEPQGDALSLSLISCDDIPEAARAQHLRSGELKIEDGKAISCEVSTLRALKGLAEAYRDSGAAEKGARIIFRMR